MAKDPIAEALRASEAALAGAPIDFSEARTVDMRPEYRSNLGGTPLEHRIGLALCRDAYRRVFRGDDPAEAEAIAEWMFRQKPGLYIEQARVALAAIASFEEDNADA